MIRVRFEAVYDHGCDRSWGSQAGSGQSVDDAWWTLAEFLAQSGDPQDMSYDDWRAA